MDMDLYFVRLFFTFRHSSTEKEGKTFVILARFWLKKLSLMLLFGFLLKTTAMTYFSKEKSKQKTFVTLARFWLKRLCLLFLGFFAKE